MSNNNLDTSKSDFLNENFSFYINDYEEFQSNFICLKLFGYLDYNNVISADFSLTDQQINNQFDKISNDIQNLCFYIRSSNLILSNKQIQNPLEKKVEKCTDIYFNYHKEKLQESSPNIPRQNLQKCIPVEILQSVTINNKKSKNFSPLFTNHKGVCRLQKFFIPIDCLVLIDSSSSIDNLYEIILEKLQLHIQAIKQCYFNYYQNENDFKAQSYFFVIDNQNSSNLIITCIYPSNQTDDQLVHLRKEIHRILELPTDHPILRRADAFQSFQETKVGNINQFSNKLENPHLMAKPSNVPNGKQSLVKGKYIYYHYMQDNFNDNGWGCAYRSFQTIFSWFKLQSITQKAVPTHLEIQQKLVDIGDKQSDFVGSSKWIGSIEISLCLSEFLNVDCKILSVSRGSELVEKARELQYHFENEGSPVMIGGGVLAHTIIGVDFNELTGEVKFLILDPHYTGADDIKSITSKGWVGWKDAKFWNENSFYNLCCPIRPKGV